MKGIASIITAASLGSATLLPATAQENDVSVHFSPKQGGIKQEQNFTIVFPEAMVPVAAVGKEARVSVLEFKPPLEGVFVWKSQTEGRFRVTEQAVPGADYRAQLRRRTRTLEGRVVPQNAVSGRYRSAPLTITPKYRPWGTNLPAQPQVRLLFNYPVDFRSAQRAIYFQDRETRERFDAALFITSIKTPAAGPSPEAPRSGSDVTVEPAAPLPVGRKIDLIVDGLRDAATRTPLPFLKALPLGETRPLKVRGVNAFGSAQFAPEISVQLSAELDPDTLSEATVKISPEVPNMKRLASGHGIRLQGDFHLSTEYTVKLLPPLASTTGYGLPELFVETVHFGGYNPEIWFPSQMFFQRSALGLNVKLLHANTKQVSWKLAAVPDHKLAVADRRLGNTRELAIDSLGLEVVAEGTLPGTRSTEAAYRDIVWRPAEEEPMLSGAYLLEVNTPLRSGKLVGHRALIFFNDLTVTQKRMPDEVVFKVTRMRDGSPAVDAEVRAVRDDNELLASGRTDEAGIVRFSQALLFPPTEDDAHHLLIGTAEGRAIQFVQVPRFSNTPGYRSNRLASLRGAIVTDRNLYRPGTTVKWKGLVRSYPRDGRVENRPEPLAGRKVDWEVVESSGDEIVASGMSRTDAYGGWEGEWQTAKDQKLGGYRVSAQVAGLEGPAGNSWIRVEEYRAPLFDVGLTDASEPGDSQTTLRLQSNYFHGGPNAGAKADWTVHWGTSQVLWDGFERDDHHSEHKLVRPMFEASSGSLRLDADGATDLELPLPMTRPWYAPGISYRVQVDVTSPEGRTITQVLNGVRPLVPLLPGIRATPIYDEGEAPRVEVVLRASAPVGTDFEDVADVPMEVELYQVVAHTVKEKLAPGVYRYRNFERYEISASERGSTGESLHLATEKPGRYVVVASLAEEPDAPPVSAQVSVAADEPAQYPVASSSTFRLQPDKDRYAVGEVAILASESPIPGKAWVSVETYGIHDQFVVDLPANASKITVPIKPEYHPNVYVSVYLMQPGGEDRLPIERMGRVQLEVARPELTLKVEPTLEEKEVEPGSVVSGTVLVTCEGKPVADADLTVMAVDEAVLKLGGWELPNLLHAFYPRRSHRVGTYQALHNHHESFEEDEIVEKGFLIGGGGGDGQGRPKLRRDFLARAFWQTRLRTDAEGRVRFGFDAPDNLTAFRVTALANTRESQFGHGKTQLRVAKRLMAEPALPRFTRVGDTVELRVVVRQTALERGTAKVECQTEGGIVVVGEEVAESEDLHDGIPRVFRFPAVVTSHEPAVIRFSASLEGVPDLTDVVETILPVHLPGILQSTGRFGQIPAGADGFELAQHVPEFWRETRGSFSLTLSHNPWLPKLTGLPNILEYPHGCFEQKCSRYLGYTVLSDLLTYLPDLQDRHANYARRIGEGLELFERNLGSERFIPYWPGHSKPNYYVTVLAAWVTQQAEAAGIEVSERLKTAFGKALDDIIRGRVDAGENTRCFALFVHSETAKGDPEEATHGDVLRDLYLHRDRIHGDSRALLAIAMLNHDVLEAERAQLVRELEQPIGERAFDPSTFYSTTRAEAMRFVARSRAGGEAWQKDAAQARERLLKLMDSSYNLSTQENLWLLIAFKALHDREAFAAFDPDAIEPPADQVSANRVSVAWKTRGLEKLADMAVRFESDQPGYYLVEAQVLRRGEQMEREDRGIRLERVVHNLTDAKRLGTEEAPFKLGDEVLINYRMSVKSVQHFTALVDELPAALETLNPNLAQVAQFYELPEEFSEVTLRLDHSEFRDRAANLYFDRVAPGQHSYAILGRITSVGTFSWPSAAITPMYETRFGGLSAPNECHVIE